MNSALLIEDDPGVAQMISGMLKISGQWQLQHAATLADGASAYEAAPTDIVLLDLGLPDVEGPLLSGLADVLEWVPSPAVVVITSHGQIEVAREAVDRGAQDYLEKATLTPSVLPRVLDYARRRHRASVRTENRAATADARADALSDWAGTISHDLRSPLATLISMTQLAAELAPTDAAMREGGLNDILRRIEDLGRRALDFADELLREAEEGTADRGELDLDRLVAEAWQLSGASSDVQLVIEDLPNNVYGLAAATRQVLVNLLANAVRHANPLRPKVQVHVESRHDAIRLEVHDNGAGIPTADRSRVFDQGVSLAGSSGLGLATVARHMQRQGGRVWVEESTLLTGAAFVLEFPSRERSRADD